MSQIEQVRTLMGEIIQGEKDRMSPADEIKQARMERIKENMIRNIVAGQRTEEAA